LEPRRARLVSFEAYDVDGAHAAFLHGDLKERGLEQQPRVSSARASWARAVRQGLQRPRRPSRRARSTTQLRHSCREVAYANNAGLLPPRGGGQRSSKKARAAL
jgi:hypothetical protein